MDISDINKISEFVVQVMINKKEYKEQEFDNFSCNIPNSNFSIDIKDGLFSLNRSNLVEQNYSLEEILIFCCKMSHDQQSLCNKYTKDLAIAYVAMKMRNVPIKIVCIIWFMMSIT